MNKDTKLPVHMTSSCKKLFQKILDIIHHYRLNLADTMHYLLVKMYWSIGQHIVEYLQENQLRAPYSQRVIEHLSDDLINSGEKGFSVAKDLRSKKVIGMHWGTFVLSLEPIMEPPKRFKDNATKYGFKEKEAIIFKIGEIQSLKNLLSYN